uniref:Uncharacterized protein n=1 Tax=Anabas testudineus TaxID=64144 RepID=A0A3Q1KDM5_ANATE
DLFFSIPAAVCERLVFIRFDALFINPSITVQWNRNDSCLVLLVPQGRSCDPVGKVQCSRTLRALNPWREGKPNSERDGGLESELCC